MNQINLDQLSDAAIKKLWQAKQAKDGQNLHEAEQAALGDMGVGEEGYYRDAHGNIVEGTKPQPKSGGYYINSSGYVQELAPGEQPPEPGSGDHLRDWLRTIDLANDPEIRAALGEENLYFETELKLHDGALWIVGQLESEGWLVTSRSQSGSSKDLKFRLPRNLSRDEAIEQATAYVRTKAGPQFRHLTGNERRMCERMAIADRVSAFVFYIQARLPEELADRFLRLGAAGDELAIQHFAADEKISQIAEEAVIQTFRWNNIRVDDQFFDFVEANSNGRLITFALLDSFWNRYSLNASLDSLEPQAPTVEDLEAMTDAEIEETLTAARRLRAGH